MRTIDADKVIEKLKEHKRLFCKNRVEFIALSDKDKARVDEIDTCIAELVNAEEVPHAQLGTNLAEVGTDCISREQAIEICDHAIDLLKGQFGAGALVAIKESIEELPPAQPERIKGHWIVKPGSDAPPTCDKCGYESRTTIKEVVDQNLKMIYCTGIDIKSNFCHNCGADMREVTE